MRRKINPALASCVVVLALVFIEPAGGSATLDGHHYQNLQQATKRAAHVWSRADRRARAKRKANRRAVSFICPMHPEIRENTRGTCPKCLMDLVAEPRNAKTGSGAKHNTSDGREP